MGGRVAGEHEQPARCGSSARASSSALEVLVRALRREREQHRPIAQLEPRAHLALGERTGSRRRPQAERHDIDALFGRAEQLDQVAPRGLRVGDHAVRACDGERHEHAHAERAHARMRLGERAGR